MTRLIDVIRTLPKGGKSLRGHDENEKSAVRDPF